MIAFALILVFCLSLSCETSLGQGLSPQIREQNQRESLPAQERDAHDNHQAAARYWYASRNPQHLPDMDEALKKVLPQARQLCSEVRDFQSWEDAQRFKAYHNAGSILLAKAYTCLYYGDIKQAAPAVELIEKEFPFAMMLEDDRSLLWVRKALRYHQHCCALYLAMSLKVVGKIEFPPERDEFDGKAQQKAIEHMAVLRLREGNINRLEHFFTAIDTSRLMTSGGDWALEIIMDAMCPLDQDAQTEPAWGEMLNAIQLWQKQKPESIFAKLCEARLLFHHALKHMVSGSPGALAVIRSDSERGLKIMRGIPRTSPAWYDTMIRLMAISGSPMTEIAPIFKEGLETFPDYSPLVIALSSIFIQSGEEGRKICCMALDQLLEESKAALAGQVLRRVHADGDLEKLQARLKSETVELALRAAAETWTESHQLRSDLGLVAVTMGNRPLAAHLMAGMGDCWDRSGWKGKEDIARALTLKQREGLSQTLRPKEKAGPEGSL